MKALALMLMALHPDAIYVNGTVVTMDPQQRAVEAVAVRGDTIVAVGDNAEIEALAGPDTERIDLGVISMGSKGSLESLSPGEAGGFISGFGDTRLKLGAVKVVQDGSIQGYTGYLREPYDVPFMGDTSYRGYPRRERDEVVAIVKSLHRAGYQIAIHGNGDAAIDDILYAYREAQNDFPRTDARHRIEHCQMAREDQLDEMKEFGISPSFFVGHAYYWGDRHREIFMGPERAARLSPLTLGLRCTTTRRSLRSLRSSSCGTPSTASPRAAKCSGRRSASRRIRPCAP